MSFHGSLETVALPDLVQSLGHGERTGTLIVEQGSHERKFFFKKGRILASSSSAPDERLGDILVDRGLVARSRVEHAMRLREETRIYFGQVLVTLGELKEADLRELIELKAEKAMSALLASPEGTFEFLDDCLPKSPMVTAELNVDRLVLASGIRLDEDRAKEDSDVVATKRRSTANEVEALLPQRRQPLVRGVASAEKPAPIRVRRQVVKPERSVGTIRVVKRAVAEESARKSPPLWHLGALIGASIVLLVAIGWLVVYRPMSREVAGGATRVASLPVTGSNGLAAGHQLPMTEAESESLADGMAVTSAAPSPNASGNQVQGNEVLVELDELVDQRAAEIERSVEARYRAELAALKAEVEAVRRQAAPEEAAPRVFVVNEGRGPEEIRREPLSEARPIASQPRNDGLATPTPAETRRVTETGPTGLDRETAQVGGVPNVESEAGPSLVRAPVQPAPLPVALVVGPRLLDRPEPDYPRAARMAKSEATVIVRVLVGPDGAVQEVERASPPVGFGFEATAIRAARASRWEPGSRGGIATPMWAQLRFDFKLTN